MQRRPCARHRDQPPARRIEQAQADALDAEELRRPLD
jgi:hypothetical protein